MNSYMNIMVRVYSTQAEARMAALAAAEGRVTSGIAAANRMDPLGRRHISSLMKFGNQLQWTGRMLLYNFTLPIAAAGVAATKWSMDQEKAFTHVKKVYGDTRAAAAQFRKEMSLGRKEAEKLAESYKMEELDALDKAFTAISNHYGVQKKEVLEVAGAWAAAGQSGKALAESVNSTMTAMIIGDMDAMKATQALISIQAQYNLSSQGLMATLANLNSVENETGAQMSDLIIAFSKAAGVARSAGVSTKQLAAYVAALVPATGSAANAGNALKTIFSRLIAPTKETTQVIEHMGINVKSMAWQSATAAEKLDIMATHFEGMGQSAKNATASVIASRWQVNKFDVLMREITNDTGYYAKALQAASNQGATFREMQQELNAVLESDPRKLQRMWVMLQNAMVKVIQPLIPYILYLADSLAKMAGAFADLDPSTQKFVLFLLVVLAAIGPIVRYVGALHTLVAVLGHGFWLAGQAVWFFGGALGSVAKVALLPFGKALSVMLAWMSGTTGAIAAQGSIIKSIFISLGSFFSLWSKAVNAIFMAGNLSRLKIWVSGLVFQLNFTRLYMGLQFLTFKAAFARLREIFILNTILFGNRWAAMWATIKGLTITGWITQTAIWRAGASALGTVSLMWNALVLAWGRMWLAIKTISIVGARNVVGIWTVMSITGASIFSKLRTVLGVIWASTALLASNIWMTMGRALVLISTLTVTNVMKIFTKMIPFLLRFGKFLLSPWSLLVMAVIGVLYAFRDQIARIWQNLVNYANTHGQGLIRVFDAVIGGIAKVFGMLPESVQKAMIAVVRVVSEAAKAVYGWFSYLNPFAHHSPSLVENVTKGMAEVNKQFSTLTNIKGYVNAAYAEVKRFGKLTAGLGISAAQQQQHEDRRAIKKAGGGGAALQSYNRLTNILNKLTPVLNRLNDQMRDQQRIVDGLQNRLDKANDKLDKWKTKLDAARDALQYYSTAPLKGMRDMEEQIFANQMAQTKLRYEMMKMEDVYGTLDQIKGKLDAINGAEESLRGQQAALRSAGAGSEILSQYDKEMKKLDQQKSKYEETADKLTEMQVKLDALQREAERLDLTKAMKFDELQHQIELAADATKELSFDEIISGIQQARADMTKYGAKVDEATKKRDAIQAQLDAEQVKLDAIKQKYDEINGAVQAINDSLNDVVSSAGKLNQAGGKGSGAGYVSPGLQNVLNAGNAGFPDPGGKGIPMRKDWKSQAKQIDKFTEDLANQTSSMFAQLNPFTPLKEKAAAVWGWIRDKASVAAGGIGDAFGSIFGNVNWSGGVSRFKEVFGGIFGFVTQVFKDISKFIGKAWDLIGPDVINIFKAIKGGVKDMWDKIGPELEQFKELWKPAGKAIKNFWTVAKPILAVIAGAILLVVKTSLSIISKVIGPAIKMIGGVLAGIIRVLRGIIEFVVGVFSGNWKMAWKGIVDILSGTWKAIWSVIKGAIQIIWGLISGLVNGIVGFFKWLWDVLVGHSIVPDIVNGIIFWFKLLGAIGKWIWKHVILPVVHLFMKMVGLVRDIFQKWWPGIKVALSALKALGAWVWDHILEPVWRKASSLWDKVRGLFGKWWDGIKNAWSVLKGLGAWFKEHVMDKVFNVVTGVWEHIRDWLSKNTDMITKPMKLIVNGVISAVNAIINGINKISDILPGDINWHIDPIEKLAHGGAMRRRGNRGMKTTGARAIVGEGKANHPEFVIPTDPTYRKRAMALIQAAASRIGWWPGGDPSDNRRLGKTLKNASGGMYGIGGWLSDRWSDIKDVAKWFEGQGRRMIGNIMNPLFAAAHDFVNKSLWDPIKIPANWGLDKIQSWISDTNSQYKSLYDEAKDYNTGGKNVTRALAWAQSQEGKPYMWGSVGPAGYDCSGFQSAVTNVYHNRPPYHRVGTTGSFPWAGWKPGVADGKGYTIGSTRNYAGSGIGHMAGTIGGRNIESRGGLGVIVGLGARGYNDSGFNQIYHLARGGIVRAGQGGVFANIGEGRYDEVVQPLPKDWRSQSLKSTDSAKNYHFYGDLSFPNITSGEDAQAFLDNLDSLTKD